MCGEDGSAPVAQQDLPDRRCCSRHMFHFDARVRYRDLEWVDIGWGWCSWQWAVQRKEMEGPALSSDDLCDILEEIQKEQERAIKIVTAASFRIEGRKQREKVAPLVRHELRRRLDEAQDKVIESFDVPKEEVEQAWAYFSGAWEQDHEDDEAARVVEAGWRVKSGIAKHIMNKELLLSALESMKDGCMDELPDAMSRLQERLDQAGVADMSPDSAMPMLQQLVQLAAQEIMRGASSNRMEKEWGMEYSQLQRRVHEYAAQDSSFKQRADQAMSEFEEAFGREQEALLKVYGFQ